MFLNYRVSKLLDSLSLSSGSSKLTKLFHHSHSSSSSSSATKKLNPSMQYLLQAGPQGLLRIWPTALSEEMNYCSFMVNMTTTCAEIIKLVFVKYEVVDDPRRFYVCEMALGKGGEQNENLSTFTLSKILKSNSTFTLQIYREVKPGFFLTENESLLIAILILLNASIHLFQR